MTSENTIITTSPPSGAPGPVPVTVTTIAGTGASAQPFVYTSSVAVVPTGTKVESTSGPEAR